MIDSVSTPGWPRGPRISAITASPRSSGPGRGADGVVLARLDPALLEQVAQIAAELGVMLLRHLQLPCQRLGLERLIALAGESAQDFGGEIRHGFDLSFRAFRARNDKSL